MSSEVITNTFTQLTQCQLICQSALLRTHSIPAFATQFPHRPMEPPKKACNNSHPLNLLLLLLHYRTEQMGGVRCGGGLLISKSWIFTALLSLSKVCLYHAFLLLILYKRTVCLCLL